MKLKSKQQLLLLLLIIYLSLNKGKVGTVVCYDRTRQGTKDMGQTTARQNMTETAEVRRS